MTDHPSSSSSCSSMHAHSQNNEDRINELHKQLCQLQRKYNRLERDRNEHVKKIAELEQLVNGYEGNDLEEALLTKSLQLAEAQSAIENLRAENKRLLSQAKNHKSKTNGEEVINTVLKENNENQLQGQNSFTETFRNLMTKQGSFRELLTPQHSYRRRRSLSEADCVDNHGSFNGDESQKLDQSLAFLHQKVKQEQCQTLIQERDEYIQKCNIKQKTIHHLTEQYNLQTVKIKMLEKMIESMSKHRCNDCSGKKKPSSSSSQTYSVDDSTADDNDDDTALDQNYLHFLDFPINSDSLCPLQHNIDTHHEKRICVLISGQRAFYTGPLNDSGVPEGTGTIKFSNGDTYYGELVDGHMHGFGTLFCAETMTMQRGHFQHDNFVGR